MRQLRGECYFLVSEQESNQRSRLGESVVGLAPAIPSTLPPSPSRPHRRWCRYTLSQLKIGFLLKSCATTTKCGNGSTCNRRAWGILKGNGVSRGSARRPLKSHSLLPFLAKQERKAPGRGLVCSCEQHTLCRLQPDFHARQRCRSRNAEVFGESGRVRIAPRRRIKKLHPDGCSFYFEGDPLKQGRWPLGKRRYRAKG